MKADYLFFFWALETCFLRNPRMFLLEMFSVGSARISSQVISGMDLVLGLSERVSPRFMSNFNQTK
mgnify:CR=1 FL=1